MIKTKYCEANDIELSEKTAEYCRRIGCGFYKERKSCDKKSVVIGGLI